VAVGILGVGMVLDIWGRSDTSGLSQFGILVLVGATFVIPTGLILWARIRPRPTGPASMSRRELAAAGSTIAAGLVLVIWLVQEIGLESIGYIAPTLAVLAVPAGLITWWRARRRRRQGRPMTGLQLTASMVFLTVLLPPLLYLSLVIALWLICAATGNLQM
jgi:hypothetical protein